MKKKMWMLSLTAICGMSSLVNADECQACETPVAVNVPSEEKKDETTSTTIATSETSASETTASESN